MYTPQSGFRGTDSFSFIASDGQATSAPATVSLSVGNWAPQAAISSSTLMPLEGEAVRFQATAADADGDPLTFHWDFGDGTSSDQQSPEHTFQDEGSFQVVLTVSDGIDTVQQQLELQVRNAAPVVVPLQAPTSAEEVDPRGRRPGRLRHPGPCDG